MAALTVDATTARPQAAAPSRVELVVASTTDVHGRLRGWDYFGDAADPARGLTRAATIVDSVRGANPGRVILVDAGDLLQGNPMTYVAARVDTGGIHPVIAAMNAMAYDAAAVGNHEFNYGLPTLRRALRHAKFPFLAANARFLGKERPLFSRSRIVQRAGVRIGIVGATTPGSMVWDRDNLRGRVRIGDILPAVRSEVAAVRRRGADVVVVVMHSGLDGPSSYDTLTTGVPSENVAARVAREVPGVDLVVFGHSHREVADTTINGVLVVQPRNWATSVSVATITVERSGARWRPVARRGVIVRAAGHAEHRGVVAAVDAKHQATVAWVNQTLGTTPVAWRGDSARVMDTPLIDFILEVERKVTGADLAATAAFDLNASLDSGDVTVAEVARLYPYDNTLRAIRVTGKQLREFLEYSARYYRTIGTPEGAQSLVDGAVPGYNFDIVAGADYTLDLSKPLGDRVTRLEVRGRPVRDGDVFTMALNNYRQTGGGGFAMLHGAPVVYDRQEEIRDLLIAEVRRQKTLRPEDYHTLNWRLEPASAVADAYRAMRASPFDSSGRAPTVSSSHLSSGRWLRIIGTNDFHGALEPRAISGDAVVRGGAAHLIAAIEAARAECRAPSCASVWLDGGDQFQGTPASNLARGRPVVELFNRWNLAASALGNHEFDWGLDTLRALLRDTRYAMLAANMLDSTGRDVPWVPDDTLITTGDIRVGVIGVLTRETPRVTRPSITGGFIFVDPVPIIEARTRSLRQRGADVVVVVAHAGGSCGTGAAPACEGEIMDIASRLTERVDAIVAGHTHRSMVARVGGTAITQAFSRGTAIGVIDIPLGSAAGTPRLSLRNVRPDSIGPVPEVQAEVTRIVSALEERFSVRIGEAAETMRRGSDGTLGNLVADAQRMVGQGDVALMNRGGVRADLPAGPITIGRVFEIAPFENALMRLTMRGSALRAYLEGVVGVRGTGIHLSGMRLEVDSTRPAGQRIVRATMADGSSLDNARTYRLILLDFLVEGGDGLGVSEGALSVEATGILDREVLERYLRAAPQPVRAPRDTRISYLRQ